MVNPPEPATCYFLLPAGSRQAVAPRCQAAAADAAKASGGTPVPKNSILVVGATGTLGRQVRAGGQVSVGTCLHTVPLPRCS